MSRVCKILVMIGIGVLIHNQIFGFFTILILGTNVCEHDYRKSYVDLP